jgi:hypothetical protein
MEPPSTDGAAARAAARYREQMLYQQIITFLGSQLEGIIQSNEREFANRSMYRYVLIYISDKFVL